MNLINSNNSKISRTNLAITLIALSVMAIPVLSMKSDKILGSQTANAIGIEQKDVTIMQDGIVTSNTINVQVPAGSVGAGFGWGKAGATTVKIEKGSIVGKTTDIPSSIWGSANTPNTPQPYYSINVGDSYRLTNVGKTTDNQAIDVIIKITGVVDVSNAPNAKKGISFNDSATLGGESDPYHSIAVLFAGYHVLGTNVKYVKAGTNTPIKITTGTYWSDIDVAQGVNETQSNSSVIVPPLAKSKLALDGKVVYSTTLDNANGMNDPDFGAYIGIGTGSEFNMSYWNPYRGPQNNHLIGDYYDTWVTLRYDLFGNFNNINFPSVVSDPQKTVTDIDEKKVNANSTGLLVREQEYDISVFVGSGSGPNKLVMTDSFPKEFKTDVNKISITGKNGANVKSLFNVALNGQNLTVTMKPGSKGNANLMMTRVNVNVKGTLPEWAGTQFKNKAVWNGGTNLPTNEVSSVTPSKPDVVKSVSVDNGNSFSSAETYEKAGKVEHNKDSYVWKLDYTLSNYTNYTDIKLIDQLENIQKFDVNNYKVYDSNGTDVTKNGTVSNEVKDGKNVITWKASLAYIKEINTKFGIKSNAVPKFTTLLKTDISEATLEQKEAYTKNPLGYVIIPNTGSLIESDHTGSVNVNSNPSHVTFPNEVTEPKKTVSDDDELLVNSNNVGLNVREQSYDISLKTSKGYGFNILELGDTFPRQFTTDLSKVKIVNSNRKDITSYFDMTLDGQKFKAVLKNDFKSSIDLKGTTITATITGSLPRWAGVIFENDALWIADENKPTNKVETYEPSEPKVEKTVSVDDGKTYQKADIVETAARVKKNKDSYIWKLDYKLSNYTLYTGIELQDTFENIQAINRNDFKVYDHSGKDVATKGTLTITEAGPQSNLNWVASPELIKETNDAFGHKSDEEPTFKVTIKTDVSKATIKEKEVYTKNKLGAIVIPNKGSLVETDRTGKVVVDSNLSHVEFPNELSEPKKTVSDDDELLVNSNNVGLNIREQSYDISVKTSNGYGFNKLELTDTFPKEFKTDLSKVKITNTANIDITEFFTLSLDGQKFKAVLHDDYKTNLSVKGTTINAKITGTLPKWLGGIFYNNALWVGDDEDNPTNNVETYEPSEPKVEKTVSIDDGKTYNKSDTLETASKVKKNKDSYIWKLDYTLSNYSNYTGIELIDQLEYVQTFDKDNFKVFDDKGVDVTSKGSLTTKENGSKVNISWKASSEYVKDVNTKFGLKSDKKPTFTTTLKTDVSKASLAAKNQYSNNALGYIIIPNKGTLIETDRTGDVVVDSNLSHVTFPNELSEPIKKVSDDNESLVNSNNVGLNVREQVYDISIKTEKGYGFNILELSDSLPKEFKTDLNKVVITNRARKDITSYFDMTLDGQKFKAVLKDEFKTSVDLKGTIITAKITGNLPVWLGSIFYNDALWVADEDNPTNTVETYEPSEPTVVKSVSVDNGDSFNKADTLETAAKVNKNKDSYIWKLDYTLSNYTRYTGIELIDELESLQTFNTKDFNVYDHKGNDVTLEGTLTTKENGTKTNISWVASDSYVKEVNSQFGIKSRQKPKFTTTLKTDVSKASLSEKNKYSNNKLGYIIIPNTGILIETDHTGPVTIKSNLSHVTFPNELSEPIKKVSDDDESLVNSNNVGLNIREQVYDISIKTEKGYGFNILELSDSLPKEFKTDLSKVLITNRARKDITKYFDLSLKGTEFKAVLKDEFKSSIDLKGTIINAKITGTLPKWLGGIFYNDALWVADENNPTNKVESYEPSEPKVEKTVSVNDGVDFEKSDTPETASSVENRPDSYIWKLYFTLSNYTKYTGIKLIDHLESLQDINQEDIKVYDHKGTDVTDKGTINTSIVKGKTDLVWSASNDYVSDINKEFGPKSKQIPKFTMTIKTNVKNSLNSDEAKFYNKELGYVVIPNTGSLIETDHTGDVLVESNPSHVKFPKPGESSVSKLIAFNGSDPLKDDNWTSSIKLEDHDDLYSYKTVFNLSKNFNYDNKQLLLTDKFENLQKYESIKILTPEGLDRTDEFEFQEVKIDNGYTTNITATPKVINNFDDKGETFIMFISGATIKGATGKQEVHYIEPNELGELYDDKNPFKEGITIPNISNLIQKSSIDDYTTNKNTERTYANFVISPSIMKAVEDDSLEVLEP